MTYTNLPSSVYLRCRCVALLDALLSTPASAPRCRLGLHLECKLVLPDNYQFYWSITLRSASDP